MLGLRWCAGRLLLLDLLRRWRRTRSWLLGRRVGRGRLLVVELGVGPLLGASILRTRRNDGGSVRRRRPWIARGDGGVGGEKSGKSVSCFGSRGFCLMRDGSGRALYGYWPRALGLASWCLCVRT